MIESKDLIFVRTTVIFLFLTFIFRWEFWPVSHYPVFSSPIQSGKFVSYRFALLYKDGTVRFPLGVDDSRRIDVYLEHEFSPKNAARKVGKLNIYAAISFLKLSYVGRLGELPELLEGLESAYILAEWHVIEKDKTRVVQAERLFHIDDDEFYNHLL